MKRLSILMIVATCTLGTGCLGVRAWTPATVNASCPITGNRVMREAGEVAWEGRSVGFCSERCIDSWSDLEEPAKLSVLRSAVHSHHGHPH